MLSAIFSSLGGQIIDAFFGKALKAFELYNNKQISMEELRSRVSIAMLDAFKTVEAAHADSLSKTYASFMGAVVQSRILQVVWAAVTISQLFVLLWHQLGIPFLVFYMRNYGGNTAFSYPSSGTTVEWGYLLVAACVGMGATILRSGPGAGSITDRLKAMVGK